MPRKKSEQINKIENESKKNKKNIMNTMIKKNNIEDDKHTILQLTINKTNKNNILHNSNNNIKTIPNYKHI